jgi:hypothetical protein
VINFEADVEGYVLNFKFLPAFKCYSLRINFNAMFKIWYYGYCLNLRYKYKVKGQFKSLRELFKATV